MSNYSEFDQFHDPSFRVLAERIREAPAFEAIIKTAQLDQDEHAALPGSAFAWPERRLFPIHTPDQAALSYLYATAKTASVPEAVMETLRDCLDVYGVKLPETRKVAAAAPESLDDYLLPERRRWRVDGPETVKIAEEALRTTGQTLPVKEQAYAATKLVVKAASYGVQLDADTLRKAGYVASDLDTAREWVEARANLAVQPHLKVAYTQIADGLSQTDKVSYDRDALLKLASTIQVLDAEAGFDRGYGRKLYDPITTVFNTDIPLDSIKTASANTVDLAGKEVQLSKLAALPQSVYEDVFGSEVLPEITTGGALDSAKLASVIPTMPRDLLQVFSKQVSSYLR